jgi:hypothetical protein
MSESAIRTAIYNSVNGVSNAGAVYDYERWAADWSAFLDLFKTTIGTTDQIRGWEVAYRGWQPGDPREFSAIHLRTHRWLVVGYLGLDDSAETEKTMSTLAELVADTLKDDAALKALAFHAIEPVLVVEPRIFGGVLCHYAELTVDIAEVVT